MAKKKKEVTDEPSNPVGRPTKFKEEYVEQAYKLCLLGMNNEELAKFFEVSKSTLCKWIAEINEFSDSVKRGRSDADADVAVSFHKRAKGYQYVEESEEYDKHGKVVKIKKTTKEVPPDAGAALNWLKNRQPDKWRDKKEVEAKVSQELDISKLSNEELQQLEAVYKQIEPQEDQSGEG